MTKVRSPRASRLALLRSLTAEKDDDSSDCRLTADAHVIPIRIGLGARPGLIGEAAGAWAFPWADLEAMRCLLCRCPS